MAARGKLSRWRHLARKFWKEFQQERRKFKLENRLKRLKDIENKELKKRKLIKIVLIVSLLKMFSMTLRSVTSSPSSWTALLRNRRGVTGHREAKACLSYDFIWFQCIFLRCERSQDLSRLLGGEAQPLQQRGLSLQRLGVWNVSKSVSKNVSQRSFQKLLRFVEGEGHWGPKAFRRQASVMMESFGTTRKSSLPLSVSKSSMSTSWSIGSRSL